MTFLKKHELWRERRKNNPLFTRRELYHEKRIGNPLYEILANSILEGTLTFHPKFRRKKYTSIIDVGCSVGEVLKHLERDSPKLQRSSGIDHSEIAKSNWQAQGQFYQHDLNTPPLKFTEDYDLIVCMEVAEHLKDYKHLIDLFDRIRNKDSVLAFCASIPGQPGNGHINCHWHGFWIKLLEDHGWRYQHRMTVAFHCEFEDARHKLDSKSCKKRRPSCYRNTIIFQSNTGLEH